jgi:hypothetical protein
MDLFLYYANRVAVALIAVAFALTAADYFEITPWALVGGLIIFAMPKLSLLGAIIFGGVLWIFRRHFAAVWNGAAHVALFGVSREDPDEK